MRRLNLTKSNDSRINVSLHRIARDEINAHGSEEDAESFSQGERFVQENTAALWFLTSGSAYSTLTSLQRKRYLFVCINRRADDNPKGCCALKDSEEVYRALKAEVAARGLAKLEARVCTSSCLDQCATGVTVLVEPDHFVYGRVTIADVPDIVDGLVKGQQVKRLVIVEEQL
jgi:(2Fe-2S) ferredoxin